jgi:hypothetical protein
MTERDRGILLLLYERHEWNRPLPGRANPQDHDTQLSEQEPGVAGFEYSIKGHQACSPSTSELEGTNLVIKSDRTFQRTYCLRDHALLLK